MIPIITKYMVPKAKASKVINGYKNTKRKICIHETANWSYGADDERHAMLQYNGNSRQASWHFTVDKDSIHQSFPLEAQCWASGTGKGNNEAIHIEMCVNKDGDYKKTVSNTAWLVAKLLKDLNLKVTDVVQHNYYSGKDCPKEMRKASASISWGTFLQMVKGHLETLPVTPKIEEYPKEAYNMFKLSDTAKEACREMIKRGVVEKHFTGDHKNVNLYTDEQLLNYALVYMNRKTQETCACKGGGACGCR